MTRWVFTIVLFFSQLGASYPTTSAQIEAVSAIISMIEPPYWIQMGKERWEFESRFEEQRDVLMPLFQQAGLIDEVVPVQNTYDYVLIHGALLSRIEQRFETVCKFWEQGVRFQTIVFLAGDRKLLDREKEETGLSVESELTRWVYGRAKLPEGMGQVPVLFIDAIGREGRRATTSDTAQAFLQRQLQMGSCLAISNQPYIIYQHEVFEKLFPKEYPLETVGAALDANLRVAIFLDTLGKIFLQQ